MYIRMHAQFTDFAPHFFFLTLKSLLRVLSFPVIPVYFSSQFSVIFVASLKQFSACENIISNVKTFGTVYRLINYLFYWRHFEISTCI